MTSRTRTSAPIAVFIYRRPDHLRRTLTSLMACDGFAESDVHVFADGARSLSDQQQVMAARAVAREMLGDRAVYVERDENTGLAQSVISGVDSLCQQYGSVIVVEDDLILSPSFLTFMNAALDRYKDDARVMQVSGYMYDIPDLTGSREAMFMPFVSSWGWGTWARSWNMFEPDVTGWEQVLRDRDMRNKFDLEGSYPYSQMLSRHLHGEVDSWAIQWYFSVFQSGGQVIYPPRSLVENAGMDGSGTHGKKRIGDRLEVRGKALGDFKFPESVVTTDRFADVRNTIRQSRKFGPIRIMIRSTISKLRRRHQVMVSTQSKG